jgi:hypothetical protein
MILNTLIFINYFFLILLSILGYGLIYSKFFNLQYKDLSLGINGILGCFVCTFVSFFTHLFFAHNFIHNLIVHLIGVIFFFYFFIKYFPTYKKKILRFFLLILSLLILLFISKNNEDFPYYHLPFMVNIIENKLQFGIGHFNYSYRTPSSLFYLQSLFYLPGIKFYLLHASGLIILIFANLFFLDKFLFHTNKNNNFIKIFAFLSFVFINLFFISLAKYGTDRAGHIVAFVIFIIFLELINYKDNFLSKCKIAVVLIIYLVSIKAYFLPYLLLLLLALYLVNKNKKLINFFSSKYFIFFSFLFFLLYLFINFSISGCFLTLLKSTCIDNLFWATSIETINHYNKWYELWAKAGATPNYRVNNPTEYVFFFNWVTNWFNSYFFTKGSDVISGIFLICIIFFIFLKTKKELNKISNKYLHLYLFIIVFFFIWFYKHPDLRYGGYILIASIFFIPLSAYLSKFKLKNNNFFFIILFLILISINIRNIARIYSEFERNDPYVYKNFPFFYIKDIKYEKIKIKYDKIIYIVSGNCWAAPSPCVQGNINVKQIGGYSFFYP